MPLAILRRAAVCAGLWLGAIGASAGQLEFVVDQTDGGVFLKNIGLTPSVIDGYTISSATGSLLPGGWTTITDNYDISGDASVDSIANWFILGTPTSNSVTEVSQTQGSGMLSPGEVVSLGLLFDITKPQGLTVTVTAGGFTSQITDDYRQLRGDYDDDLDVDVDDYLVYLQTYGETGLDLAADGNDDGIVNAADYTVWRDSPELLLTPALLVSLPTIQLPGFVEEYPSSHTVTIPEPNAALMAATLLAGLLRRCGRA